MINVPYTYNIRKGDTLIVRKVTSDDDWDMLGERLLVTSIDRESNDGDIYLMITAVDINNIEYTFEIDDVDCDVFR